MLADMAVMAVLVSGPLGCPHFLTARDPKYGVWTHHRQQPVNKFEKFE